MPQGIVKKIQKARLVRAFFFMALILALPALTSCTSLESRHNARDQILQDTGFKDEIIRTSGFSLFAASKGVRHTEGGLTIFIEGDGYAWADRYTLSDNPTPLDPIALQMAADYKGSAYYLARPCQYISEAACTPALWSYARFSPKVMDTYNEALDQLKSRHKARNIELVGFSGGAYIALVLAATRSDIQDVTTVAGVLDPKAWTSHHDISPLMLTHTSEALLQDSARTNFTHFCSPDDEIMPCGLTDAFIAKAQRLGLHNHSPQKVQDRNHEELGFTVAKML